MSVPIIEDNWQDGLLTPDTLMNINKKPSPMERADYKGSQYSLQEFLLNGKSQERQAQQLATHEV
jgi:hypothetical protein